GMAFTLFDGRAHFHRAGKLPSTELPWFRGAFPAGARVLGDAVQWVPQPRRQQGVAAHRSPGGAGFHQHFFDNAPSFLHVQGGDRVYAYVYLDPADPPSALLLQWRVGGSWEQRAYWGPPGAAGIVWGTDGTNSRRRMGDLPPAGRWVRLEVPAALVGLANQQVNGLAFGTVDGVATWDAAGVVRSRGAGLRAEYFAGRALAGPALLERVDASVDFDWGAGSPDPAVPADEFSARWTGLVVPKYNEDYTFSVPADDGVRLWVDDTLVVDRWIITAVPPEGQEGRGTIRLTAGRAHRIRLEFFEAGGAAVIRLRWSSPSTPLQVIPAGQLFPPLGTPVPETAAVALEDAWLEEALPPNASVAGSGAWSWVPHPALLPPEDAFDTADAVEGRRESLAVARLREQLLQGGVVSAAHQAELDRGLAHFVNFLDAKVKAADDYADFSFVRVQSDMYRLRQLMMGTTAATRLATSPAVAGIVRQSDSALDMRSKLADYLRYARLGTVKTAQGGVKLHAMKQDMGGGEVFNTQSLGVSSRALVANTHTALGFSPMVVSVAQPVHAATAVAWQPAPPPRTAPPAGVPAGPTVTVQPPPPPRTTAPPPGVSATVVPQAAAWASPAVMSKTAMVTRIAPAYQGSRAGAALSSVWLKAPIVGEAYDFRTVTVAERAVAPEANEAKSFSVLTRYEVLSGLARLDLPLDDLVLPGFADVGPLTFIDPAGKEQPIMQGGKQAVGHRMRRISRKAWDGDPIEMPLLVQKRFGDVKSDAQLTDLVLEVNDPTNGDEAAFFALSVELLDATTAALRAAEGRIQQYRDAADAARVVLGQAQESARAADSRLRALENELGEVRHDLAVARALYEDEKERVRQLNERRRTIVRDHVEFFAFQRPRVAFGILDAPRRPLDPAFTQSPVPACLNSSEQAPAELRAIVEVLRESPLRFFRNAGRLLGGLNTLESLRGTLEAARERARTRGVPSLLESLNERLHGGLGAAIARTLQAQQQVMLQYRHALAYVDWGWLHHALWSRLQDEALQHLSLGDVIDAAHGRTSVDRGASRELDDVLKIATCLYREIGQVRPALRLDWAEAVSQYDEAVDLRNLFSLPRFSEVDYLSRREMQAMVDWLYARVEPSQPEAGAMMSDVVRICILLASHAPVNTIVSATVTRETEARAGGTVELRVDPSRARVGMHVLLQDSERRPVHGVIEDMSEGLAVARVLQAGASSVKILKDARAQLGERASLDAYALAGGRPPAITARYPVARLWV
ncbi:MAG TPA: PA14 domain-containing protein, partial [Longimicrobium sp.]|nr:PA14 domain-containing protein [Longimicrobium sp.]